MFDSSNIKGLHCLESIKPRIDAQKVFPGSVHRRPTPKRMVTVLSPNWSKPDAHHRSLDRATADRPAHARRRQSRREIAAGLGVSWQTIHTHDYVARMKLHAKTSEQLIAEAIKRELIG
jgi:hypothetical protein